MERYKLLLVEDEPTLGGVLTEVLVKNGYEVYWESDGAAALDAYHRCQPHVAVIDIMLPGLDGYSIVREIRKHNPGIPLIFLTAKTGIEDVVKGFRTGANDYLKKPFMIEELMIRLEALLQRPAAGMTEETVFTLGRFEFDSVRQELRHGTEKIQLSGRESDLLRLFARNSNRLISKQFILTEVWGHDDYFNSRNLDVYVSRLRKYLSTEPTLSIINIRGAGYKLVVSTS